MAQIKTERSFTIILSKREFLIVGKALRGSLKESERAEALDLQKALARARHTILEQELHESQKLVDNIEAEEV